MPIRPIVEAPRHDTPDPHVLGNASPRSRDDLLQAAHGHEPASQQAAHIHDTASHESKIDSLIEALGVLGQRFTDSQNSAVVGKVADSAQVAQESPSNGLTAWPPRSAESEAHGQILTDSQTPAVQAGMFASSAQSAQEMPIEGSKEEPGSLDPRATFPDAGSASTLVMPPRLITEATSIHGAATTAQAAAADKVDASHREGEGSGSAEEPGPQVGPPRNPVPDMGTPEVPSRIPLGPSLTDSSNFAVPSIQAGCAPEPQVQETQPPAITADGYTKERLLSYPSAPEGLQVPKVPTPGPAGNPHSDAHDVSTHASSFIDPDRDDVAGSYDHDYVWFYRAAVEDNDSESVVCVEVCDQVPTLQAGL